MNFKKINPFYGIMGSLLGVVYISSEIEPGMFSWSVILGKLWYIPLWAGIFQSLSFLEERKD